MSFKKVRGEVDEGEQSNSTSKLESNHDGFENGSGDRKKRRKRRKFRKKQLAKSASSHVVLNLPSSSTEIEPAGECSKRDSSSSLGGTSSRHNTLRESLLTVLGKLVVWKGTRYRPTPTSSSLAPPNSPPATECIGRTTSFFSSGESTLLPEITYSTNKIRDFFFVTSTFILHYRRKFRPCNNQTIWYIFNIYIFFLNFKFKKSESWQTFLSNFSLILQIIDLISYFVWIKIYRQNNHHIDHMVWFIHSLNQPYAWFSAVAQVLFIFVISIGKLFHITAWKGIQFLI